MSGRRKRKGVMGLAVVAFCLFFGIGILYINQLLINGNILVSKKIVNVGLSVDSTGTALVSLLRSGKDGRTGMYAFGSLYAEERGNRLDEQLKLVEDAFREMGFDKELMVGGIPLSEYTGSESAGQQQPDVKTSIECSPGRIGTDDITLAWPSSGVRITSGIGYRNYGGGCNCHGGIDIGASGDGEKEVYAAADGKVVDVYPGPGQSPCTETSCVDERGNMVAIQHAGGYRTYYYHLESIMVKKGQDVTAGEQIGVAGNTGDSDAPHLHFEVRKQPYRADADSLVPCSAFGSVPDGVSMESCVHMTPGVCIIGSTVTAKTYYADVPLPGARSGREKTEISVEL
jgi:murein DD-endopeptidase MepM/ murein hydrolase activator NlpD